MNNSPQICRFPEREASLYGLPMRYLPAVVCALALAAALPFYGGAMRPVFALPSYFLVGLVGVGALLTLRRKSVSRASTACVLSVLALAGWLIWRVSASPDAWLASSYLRLILACLTVYLLFAAVITNPLHRLAFISVLLALALVQVGLGAWQFTHHHDAFPLPWFSEQLRLSYSTRLWGRAHGFYLNANHLVWFLNVATIFALAVTICGRWGVKTKVITGYVALMALMAATLTLSRGGMLALTGGLAAFFLFGAIGLFFARGDRRLLALLILMAVFSLGAVTWVYRGSVLFQGRMSVLLEDSYRPAVFTAALRQLQLEPLWGTGAGTFLYYGREFRNFSAFSDDIYAHNDWLQLAADFGFPALALLLLVVVLHVGKGMGDWVLLLRRSINLHSGIQGHGAALCLGALASLAAMAIHSFFDFNMQIPVNALLAAACVGILANVGVEGVGGRVGFGGRLPWVMVAALSGGWLLLASGQAVRPEFYWLRAENALLTSDWPGAADLARRGIALQPSHPRLHRTLGEALFLQGKYARTFAERALFYQEASVEFATAIALAPLDWTNHRLAAECLYFSQRFQKASLAVIEAMALNPNQGGPYALYANILESEGKLSEARQMYVFSAFLPGCGRWMDGVERVDAKIRRQTSPPTR